MIQGKKTIDLRGEICPVNLIKAKIALEGLKSGEILEILLDHEIPLTNLPRSLELEGHLVLEIIQDIGFHRVFVLKEGQDVSFYQ